MNRFANPEEQPIGLGGVRDDGRQERQRRRRCRQGPRRQLHVDVADVQATPAAKPKAGQGECQFRFQVVRTFGQLTRLFMVGGPTNLL